MTKCEIDIDLQTKSSETNARSTSFIHYRRCKPLGLARFSRNQTEPNSNHETGQQQGQGLTLGGRRRWWHGGAAVTGSTSNGLPPPKQILFFLSPLQQNFFWAHHSVLLAGREVSGTFRGQAGVGELVGKPLNSVELRWSSLVRALKELSEERFWVDWVGSTRTS